MTNAALLARLSELSSAVALTKATFDAVLDDLAAGVADLAADVQADARPGLWTDGPVLRRKSGAAVVLRGVESFYGDDAASNPTLWVAQQTAFGANSVAPLVQNSQFTIPRLTALLDATAAAGVVLGLNFDALTVPGSNPVVYNGRARALAPDVVALVNSYDHVFLELEDETGWPQTEAAWVADVNGLVAALRGAGHVHPIKVGSPFGGRYFRHAVNAGAQVLAADPLHKVLFTFQAYVRAPNPGGWDFLDEINAIPYLASDPTGCLRVVAALVASGLCFCVGLDHTDDVGVTVWAVLGPLLHAAGVSWQWWVWANGGDVNALFYPGSGWNYATGTTTATGAAVAAAGLFS